MHCNIDNAAETSCFSWQEQLFGAKADESACILQRCFTLLTEQTDSTRNFKVLKTMHRPPYTKEVCYFNWYYYTWRYLPSCSLWCLFHSRHRKNNIKNSVWKKQHIKTKHVARYCLLACMFCTTISSIIKNDSWSYFLADWQRWHMWPSLCGWYTHSKRLPNYK